MIGKSPKVHRRAFARYLTGFREEQPALNFTSSVNRAIVTPLGLSDPPFGELSLETKDWAVREGENPIQTATSALFKLRRLPDR